MPFVPLNYLAVFFASLAGFVLGSIWFGALFGKQYMKLTGMTQEKVDEFKKQGMIKSGMARKYAITYIGALVMAFVLAHTRIVAVSIFDSFMTALWVWLGFMVPVSMSEVLWGKQPIKLWMITISFYFVELFLMGIILSFWK